LEPKVSVVIPVRNEAENIRQLCGELKESFRKLNLEYELIFVDDGSTDNTFIELSKLHKKDGRIKVIRFRKKFGKSAALSAGFDFARGQTVITIDGDLQNDPADIPKFLNKLDEGYDIVSGWRKNRFDSLPKRTFSIISNRLRMFLMGESIHDSVCGFKAYRREAIDDIELFGGMHRYIPSLLAGKGFKVGEVIVNHRRRIHGKTKYGYERLLRGLLDLLYIKFWSEYRFRPLHIFGGVGILISAIGFLIGCYLLIEKFFYGQSLSNRPLLNLVILMIITGIQFLFFGFISEILIRLYFKKEKTYKIKEKIL